eukprot:TRINITY_DN30665_c0_g1_i1.p1 TRINITY_DN30665_c0_g1~~TRINITY_DN30665_c0_g1_i1.p1  ORF type:complete len:101 (-),score=22.50 TRINITY_DN30665_c0_g1_i1:612-914(-)
MGMPCLEQQTLIMVECLFAMIFGASVLSVLAVTGLMPRPGCSSCDVTYGLCQVAHDVRTVCSFLLVCFICCYTGIDSKHSTNRQQQGRERCQGLQLVMLL